MSFETMYPHIRGKGKKIVAVTFEDGTTLRVDENDIRGYLRCLDERRENEHWRKLGMGPTAVSLLEGCRKVFEANRAIWKSEQAQKNASKPRKKKRLTKAAIVQYREGFKEKYGKARGWRKSAAAHFKTSVEVISNRMKASDSAKQ